MLVVFLLQAVVMFALGVFVFDADGPDELLSLLAVMLLGVATFAASASAARRSSAPPSASRW